MTPIALLGAARAPIRAHILRELLARTNGAALANAVVNAVLEASRRGTLCEVNVDRDVDDTSEAFILKRES